MLGKKLAKMILNQIWGKQEGVKKNQMDKNMHFAILKRFTKNKKVLLNCLIIIYGI